MGGKSEKRENGKANGKRETWKTYVFPVRRSKNKGGGGRSLYHQKQKINIKKETSSYTPISLQAGGSNVQITSLAYL